ncbi:MAG TPA: cytochrome c family protein [Telluria sp.]
MMRSATAAAVGAALALAAPGAPAPATQTVPASAPAASIGNAAAGKVVYERCLACHALAYDRTGPRHCGLFGRRAGSVPGFDYSEAMQRSRIVWDDKTLNLFLADPPRAVPGTSMGYAGIKDSAERADLIAYLKQACPR